MGFYTVVLVIHTILVIFLILMVLLQRTDSDGMGGLGGGGGGNQFLSGRTTANIMTRTTSILAAAFMASSLFLAIYAGRMTGSSILDSVGAEQQSAPSTTTPDAETLIKDKAPGAGKARAAEPSGHKEKPGTGKTGKADKADKAEEKPAKSTPSAPKPE